MESGRIHPVRKGSICVDGSSEPSGMLRVCTLIKLWTTQVDTHVKTAAEVSAASTSSAPGRAMPTPVLTVFILSYRLLVKRVQTRPPYPINTK